MTSDEQNAAAERLLDGLDDTQRLAVTSPAAPLAILAGAGSGKTRVLTRRIAWKAATDQLDPRHTVAVTFTRKAAGELNTRLRQLGMRDVPTTGTFHSLAYAQLRQRWSERGIAEPQLLDRKIGFIARLLPRRPSGRGDNLALDVTGEIEWAAARALSPDAYRKLAESDERDPPLPAGQMAQLMADYADAKRKQRLVDFDDLLRLATRDLMADPDYAAAIRWRHRHLYVDEFQDINPVQHGLLLAWKGERNDLTVVGDPNQAIYAWNGADASNLMWFEDRNPGAGVIRLGHNYRSTPQIVTAGHAVLPSNARAEKKPTAHRGDGPEPTIRGHDDDRAEAAAVARAVRDSHAPGLSWSHQAVLVRTNAQTALIADAMRRAQIPVRVRGGAALVEQPEVRNLLDFISGSDRPLSEVVIDLRDEVDRLNPGRDAAPAELDRQANRDALVRLADDHAAADGAVTGAAFVAWLRASSRSDGIDAVNDAVEITTFHAAKGLEWPIVHLAGIEKGYVPIGYADTPAQLAEERRLLHVAITRAERELHLTWAKERTFGQRSSKRTKSPYLDALTGDEVTPLFKQGDPATRRDGLKSVKDRLTESVVDNDDPLVIALKAKRMDLAREEGVPAYVIFNNKTLAGLVDQRPADLDALLDVAGIGPAKAARYGEEILDVLSGF